MRTIQPSEQHHPSERIARAGSRACAAAWPCGAVCFDVLRVCSVWGATTAACGRVVFADPEKLARVHQGRAEPPGNGHHKMASCTRGPAHPVPPLSHTCLHAGRGEGTRARRYSAMLHMRSVLCLVPRCMWRHVQLVGTGRSTARAVVPARSSYAYAGSVADGGHL